MIETTNIYLYADVPLSKDKNRIIEDIANYLNSPFITRTIGYFRNNFTASVTIENVMQTSYDMASVSIDNVNYCKVVPSYNSVNKSPLYYFVTNKEWVSESAVKLTLEMDVLNTFQGGYTFSDKTHITRKHQDRFTISEETITIEDDPDREFDGDGNCTFTESRADGMPITSVLSITVYNASDGASSYVINNDGSVTVTLTGFTDASLEAVHCSVVTSSAMGKIDRYSEGITPNLFKTSEKTIYDTNDSKWWLVYRNKNDIDATDFQNVNPVDCLLIPEQRIGIQYTSSDIVPGSLENAHLYKVSVANNDNEEFSCYAGNDKICDIKVEKSAWVWYSSIRRWCYFFKNSNSKICLIEVIDSILTASGNASRRVVVHDELDAILFTKSGATLKAQKDWYQSDDPYTIWSTESFDYPTTGLYSFAQTQSKSYSIGMDELDKTDNKLIKTIMLPYSPVEIAKIDDETIRCPNGWKFSSTNHILTLDSASKFYRLFVPLDGDGNQIENPINILKVNPSAITGNESRIQTNGIDDYEFKLFHSDFYRPKFVYDSFSMDFILEQLNYGFSKTNLSLEYDVTRTINSKFLFRFPDYISNLKYSSEDYPGTIPVARNNEGVLYNSQYINYLRTGYNYDLKNKHRSELASGLGILGNLLTMGTSIGTGNPLGAMMGASSIAQNIANISRAEENIQEKIIQAKLQAVSVSGSDDIDLLDAYSDNKAKICYYSVSPRVKQQLSDLFYYFGYTNDEYGVPSMNNRIWFDYIQCTAIIQPTKNMTKEMVDALVQCYANGVTVFHKYNNTWNLAQNKENWERNLFE